MPDGLFRGWPGRSRWRCSKRSVYSRRGLVLAIFETRPDPSMRAGRVGAQQPEIAGDHLREEWAPGCYPRPSGSCYLSASQQAGNVRAASVRCLLRIDRFADRVRVARQPGLEQHHRAVCVQHAARNGQVPVEDAETALVLAVLRGTGMGAPAASVPGRLRPNPATRSAACPGIR